MPEQINELSILVTALLAVAVGTVWYSPLLFGPMWMKSSDHTMNNNEVLRKEIIQDTIQSGIVQIIFFIVLAHFASLAITEGYSLLRISLLLTALVALCIATLTIREKRPYSYFFVHSGYVAIIIIGGTEVLALWPW